MITRCGRLAFTLIEVIIAMSIFVALLGLVFESQLGIRSYVGMEEQQNEMESIGRRLTTYLVNDFANAARFYEPNASGDMVFLYPVLVRTPTDPAPGTVAETLRKDIIEFVRIRTSMSASTAPGQESYATVNIETSWVPLSQYATAPYTNFLVLNPTATDGGRMVRPVWEAPVSGLDWSSNEDSLFIRHYALQVVDVDSQGRGRLVRRYWNGDGNPLPAIATWPIDQELATSVKRFSIETYDWQTVYYQGDKINRPKPTLATNQVRFEIVLERDQTPGQPPVTRVVNVTAAMRSITD